MEGYKVCREHRVDEQLGLTLHEMNDRVRILEQEGDLWRLSRFKQAIAARRGRPRLTEEEKLNKYCNTYCKAITENGRTCNKPIPIKERVCEACRERLLPTKTQ
jgi:hypothetical protein